MDLDTADKHVIIRFFTFKQQSNSLFCFLTEWKMIKRKGDSMLPVSSPLANDTLDLPLPKERRYCIPKIPCHVTLGRLAKTNNQQHRQGMQIVMYFHTITLTGIYVDEQPLSVWLPAFTFGTGSLCFFFYFNPRLSYKVKLFTGLLTFIYIYLYFKDTQCFKVTWPSVRGGWIVLASLFIISL